MKTYQDYLYQAKHTEVLESVKASHTKYLEEHARGATYIANDRSDGNFLVAEIDLIK